MTTTHLDTTRRGYRAVHPTNADLVSRPFGTRREAQAWIDRLPSACGVELFDIIECPPLPAGPVASWAQHVLVEEPAPGEVIYTAQATWKAQTGPGLPSVGVEQRFELTPEGWAPLAAADVFVSAVDDYVSIHFPHGARALSAALSQAADVLARVQGGE